MIKHKYITYREDREAYQIKLTVPVQQDGKVIRKPITRQAKDLDDAIQIRDDLINLYRLDKSLLLDVQCVNKIVKHKVQDKKLDKLIAKWYETYKRPFLGFKTRNNYDTAIYDRIIPAFGNLDVDTLTRDIVQKWIIAVQQGSPKKLSQETARAIICKLHSFYDYLIDINIVSKNPCQRIIFLKTEKKIKHTISPKEKFKILMAAKQLNYVYYVLFFFLFYSGVRRGEALGLRWSDIDFTRKNVHIENTIQMDAKGKSYVKPSPKNDGSIRDIPITDAIILDLQQLKSHYMHYHDGIISDYVFRNKNKVYLDPNNISQTFKRICRNVGLDNISIHCTRHTMATTMINRGVPISVVQAIGGWTSPKILLSNYVHVSNTDIRNALIK